MKLNKPLDPDFRQMADEIANYQVERFYEAQSRRDRRAVAQHLDGEYDLFRLIQAQRSDRVQQLAPFEHTVSQRLAEQFGRNPRPGCDFVPVPSRQELQRLQRDVQVATTGQYLVSSDVGPGGLFVHYLDQFFPFSQLGIQRLTLERPCTVPGVSANVSTTWTASETATITEDQFTFATSTSTPKHLGAYLELSGQLFKQASPLALNFIMQAAARAVSAEVSKKLLVGTGTTQVLGVYNYPGITTLPGGSANHAKALDCVEALESRSALLMPTAAAFVVPSNIAKAYRTRDKGTGAGMCMTRNDLAGYPCVVTQATSANSMTFADWSQLVLLEYGQLEVGTDPYGASSNLFKAGLIGVRVWWTVDTILLNPQSFVTTGSLS